MLFNNYKIYIITLLYVSNLYTMQENPVQLNSTLKPYLENKVLLWDKLSSEKFDLVFSKKNSLRVFEYCCNNNIQIKGINELNTHLLQEILDSPKRLVYLEQLYSRTDQKLSNFGQILYLLSKQKIKIESSNVIEFFLDKKTDINEKDVYGQTSFHYIAKLLQESDKNDFSDISISEKEPVLCTNNYYHLIKSLSTSKGDPNIKNNYNETPFFCAMIGSIEWPKDNFEKNINVWLDHKANPNSEVTSLNKSTMEILLQRSFDMNRVLAVFLSKRDVLTLDTADKVLTSLEERANNLFYNEEQLRKSFGDQFDFLSKKNLNETCNYVNERYNNITLENIKDFKEYIIRVDNKNNDLIKNLAENSLKNRSKNLLNRLFDLQQKPVIKCISESIESCDADALEEVLKYNGKFIDENLLKEGCINKVISIYNDLKSMHQLQCIEGKKINLQKITYFLLESNAKPYLFCDNNEFPYEAIFSKKPSDDEIMISNLLLDGIVKSFSRSINQNLWCWLLCMKRLGLKMPSPLKKIISNMDQYDISTLAKEVETAKENKWYDSHFLMRNNLHDNIKKMLDRWGIHNPEKPSIWESK